MAKNFVWVFTRQVNYATLLFDGYLSETASSVLIDVVSKLEASVSFFVIDVGDSELCASFLNSLELCRSLLISRSVPLSVVTNSHCNRLLLKRTLKMLSVFDNNQEIMRLLKMSPRIGDILVDRSFLTRKELIECLKVQASIGGLIGQILVANRLVTPIEMAKALCCQADAKNKLKVNRENG